MKKPLLSNVHGDARFAKAKECADLLRGGVHLGYLGGKRLGYSGEQHLITIAPTGTGKGATTIIPTLLDYDASCIVIDPKGQAAAVTARARREMGHTVYFINPFGEHGLPDSGFNPLAGLDPQAPNFAAAVAVLADALITPDDHSSAHWSDSARSLVKCLIMWTCIKEENPTLPTALTPLGWGLEKFRALMLEINDHDYRPMAHLAGRFTGDEYKDAPGIISTAVTQTEIFLEPLTAASLSRHSFEWIDLKRRGVTVYLIPNPNSLESHGRWFRLMVASALSGLYTSEKAEKPVLFILDEFAQLGRLAAIESAVGIGRGYGIQFWPILQDLNQLEDLYGKRAESFMANMGIIQVFRPNDPNTAAYFSGKAGQSTVGTTGANESINSSKGVGRFGTATKGQSSGYSYGETGKPLFSVQDLAGLPLDQQIIFKAGLQYPILADRVAYYHDAALAGRYDPDPYHLGQPPPPPPPTPVVWGPAAPKVEDLRGWGWGVPGVALVAGLGVDILLGGGVAAAKWAAGTAVGVATLALGMGLGKERGLRTKKILNAVGNAKWSRRSLILLLTVVAGLTSFAHLKVNPATPATPSTGTEWKVPGVGPERHLTVVPPAPGSPEPWHPEAIPLKKPDLTPEEIQRIKDKMLQQLRGNEGGGEKNGGRNKKSQTPTTLPKPGDVGNTSK